MKTLCRGSMRTGERTPAPAAPRLVACVLCGRVLVTMRPHTAQVPRHRPKVTMHRRGRCLTTHHRCTVEPVGESAENGGLASVGSAPPLPGWIAVGDLVLHRVRGDFPDELVFCGSSGEYTLWVKSRELLAGPWDWIIEEGKTPIDLGGPFLSREEATANLEASLIAAGIACPPAPDEIVSVPAAPAAPAPTPRSTAVASRDFHPEATAADDPELMGLALDLAIVALRRARARLAPARAA